MNDEARDTGFDRRLARNPIAIVGLSGLFPRSRNLQQFWANVMSATDCMQDVPENHWRTDDYYDPDAAAEDKSYSRRGGFLPEVQFSPLEFGLPPNTLEVTDVLQLLSLVVARDLMHDAGCDEALWYNAARTGVILGVTGANALIQPLAARLQTPVIKEVLRSCDLSEQEAAEVAEKFKKAYPPWEENSFPGMLGNLVAGRIANRFDLGATNCTVDAACASSLAAIKMSVSELLEGRADLMISGGCDAENTILMYMCFSKTMAFSKSGVIRPFDADADGTLIGEGIGMLALKRLSDAERDKDRVYAVIRGIGSASDGRFKSIYAPRAAGQITCLKRAYEDADCSPGSIELLEGHGTGTAVGDATELSALHTVFTEATSERQFVALGSVKSQIGHTKAAAGAAGMIKLALSLYHKVLPSTINVAVPSAAIDFENSAFYVNTQARPWIRDPRRPRRAGVSAFGFGGTDFHVVLEEHDAAGQPLKVLHPTARAYIWHAADPGSLARLLGEGAAAADDGVIPAEDARIGFAAGAGDVERLLDLARVQLNEQATRDQWSHPAGIFYRRRSAAATAGKVAALFSGQGSQYVGMGRDAVLNVPLLRAAFDEANQQTGGTLPLSSVVFPPSALGSGYDAREGLLRRTEYAQPAICALASGQYRFLAELGFAPDGTMGHSLGELTALWAAGCFADEDLFRLVGSRARAMTPQEGNGQDPGSMAVIKATETRVRDLLTHHEGLVVCNLNAPEQVVVGGGSAAIDDLLTWCSQHEMAAQRLPVAAAFHTPFVAHAVELFRPAVDATEFRPPVRPVYANTSGAAYGDDLEENRRILTEQLINPVSFAPQVRAMYQDGFRIFVEFGPKRALARLVTASLPNHNGFIVCAVDGGPGRDSDVYLKRTAVELAVLGLPLTGINRYSAVPEVEPAHSKLSISISGVNIVSDARKAAYRDAIENGYRVDRGAVAPTTAAWASGSVPPPRSASAPERVSPPELILPPELISAPELIATAIIQPAIAPAGGGNGAQHPAGRDGVPPAYVPPAYVEPAYVESAYVPPPLVPPAYVPPARDGLLEVARQHLALHSDYLEGQLHTADRLVTLAERAEGNDARGEVRSLVEAITEHELVLGRTHTRASEILRDLAGARPGSVPGPASLGPASLGPASLGPASPGPISPALALAAAETAIVAPPDVGPAPAELSLRAPASPAIIPLIPPTPADQPAPVTTWQAPIAAESPEPGPTGPGETSAREALLAVVADKTGFPADMLEPGMDMEADLGIDSIKRVEILGALRERYPQAAAVGPEQMAELRTLADVVALIAPQEAAQMAPSAGGKVDPVAVQRELLAVVADKTGFPADMLEPGMDMEADLGIDSIKRVEILGALRERYPQAAMVGPEQMAELRTLADVVALISPVVGVPASAPEDPAAPPTVRTDAPGVLRRHPQLCPLPAVDRQPDVYAAGPIAILVDDGSALCQSLAAGLSALGWEIAVLRLPGARPRRYKRCRVWDLTSWDEYELQDAEDALSGVTGVELCVYVAAEAPATWEDASDRLAHAVMLAKHVQLPLARAADGGRAAFITVSRLDGAFGLRGTASEPAALLGSLQGMVKTLASEAPELFCRALDIAPDVDDESAAGLVIAEAYDVAAEPLDVAYDGTQRQTIALTDAPPPRSSLVLPELTADDVLLVTGGARGVTAQCIKSLMRQTPCHLLLLGRTMLEEEPDWAVLAIGESAVKAAAAHHLRDVEQKPTPREVDRLTRRLLAQREIRANMADLQELGADADYLPVDITDAKVMAAALAPWAERITGVIHGAGVLADRLILDKTPAEVSQVLAVKLAGLRNALAVADPGRLRHLALFASVAGFFGNRGQVDYAMANAALNSVALAWKSRHPGCHVTAVNWGAWAGGMVTPQLQQLFEQRGVALIPMDVGAKMFAEQFTSERMADVVTVIAPAVPLGKRPHRALITAPVVIERVLDGLQTEPVIQDHCLAGHPVLPATVALGWCINALERLYPGMAVAEARGFKVFKGVIFNGDAAGTYRLQATPQPDGSRVDVLIGVRGPDWTTPHYGGSFRLVPWAQVRASTIDLGTLADGGESGDSPYGDGTLFHGPALQGLRRTLAQDQTQLIAECELGEARLANTAYDGRNYDPVLSDLLLQAPLVWVRRFRDSVCLPVSVEHIEIHERLPSAAPFLVVVDQITDQGLTVTCSVTACSPEGAVYERFSGVSVALSQAPDTKLPHRGPADVREQ